MVLLDLARSPGVNEQWRQLQTVSCPAGEVLNRLRGDCVRPNSHCGDAWRYDGDRLRCVRRCGLGQAWQPATRRCLPVPALAPRRRLCRPVRKKPE